MVSVALHVVSRVEMFKKERMIARRLELELTQTEAGKKANMLQSQWTKYEQGATPGADVLARIADALDCSADYLVGLTDKPDQLGGLTTDEFRFLKEFRARRLALEERMLAERQMLNDAIASFPDESRHEVIVFLAELLKRSGGKFNNLPGKS